MKRLFPLLAVFISAVFITGCATTSYLPALGNVSVPTRNCSPVYVRHTPSNVAMWETSYEAITKLKSIFKENNSIIEKMLPSGGTFDALGRNAAPIGLSMASIVEAFKDNLSLASVIGSTVTAGLGTLTEARSEDKTQSRVDVCLPDDAKRIVYKDSEVNFLIEK